jgi:hypothetical protein
MDAQRLRQKAEQTRALARQITDEQTRVAALDLATHYERQAAAADAQCEPSLLATGAEAAVV